jgi:2,4-didehydro-3-deoxy-L-rhamnonate hydrolase
MTATPDTTDFALGTFSVAGAAPFAGLLIDGRAIAAGAESVPELLQRWNEAFPALRRLPDDFRAGSRSAELRERSAVENLHIHLPVYLPRNVYCAGMNYRKHVIELIMSQSGVADRPDLSESERRAEAEKTMDVRAAGGEPFVFIKAVSSVIGARDPVPLPEGVTRPDWELELGVVVGRPARYVKRDEALKYIAGYEVVNDQRNVCSIEAKREG